MPMASGTLRCKANRNLLGHTKVEGHIGPLSPKDLRGTLTAKGLRGTLKRKATSNLLGHNKLKATKGTLTPRDMRSTLRS